MIIVRVLLNLKFCSTDKSRSSLQLESDSDSVYESSFAGWFHFFQIGYIFSRLVTFFHIGYIGL